MKNTLISIFIFSLVFGIHGASYAQETPTVKSPKDSVYYERYGLRLGIDLSKIGRTLIDDNYTGFGVIADYRIRKKWFVALALGNERLRYSENNLDAKSAGSYGKIGVNYNVYNNWLGMQNEIYVGLRYGFSSFSETLLSYTVFDRNHYFPPEIHENINEKYKNLNAHWAEFQLGIKAEVLHNVYLGIHTELKRMISAKAPSDFANLWIPGYNRNYDHSAFGIGWGYSVSYLIPITKKPRKRK